MDLPKRKQTRLQGYDYSQNGGYFITICIKDKQKLLWKNDGDSPIWKDGTPILSNIGSVIDTAINNISNHYPGVIIDKYIIMPNHIHIILILQGDGLSSMSNPTITTIIRQLKGYVTKQIGFSIWQKLFYDRVIRNETDYRRYWQYIDENPLKWVDDEYYV